MNRRQYIIGNWKMNKTIEDAKSFISFLKNKEAYIAVPYTAINAISKIAGSKIIIGAQNVSQFENGPYTGEISAEQLKEAGAKFVLIGHSERRTIFSETNKIINLKIKMANRENLQVVLCVGENEKDRKNHLTQKILQKQIEEALQGIVKKNIENLIIAYEPVWAIGTGSPASAETANEAHHICRNSLSKIFDNEFSNTISILYGGSVNSTVANNLIKQDHIDGFLVGGSSLDVNSFNGLL